MRNVSVVVVCLNEIEFMDACLKSLVEQDYPAEHFEIVVADGASTDGTQDVVLDYAGRYPHVRLVVEPKKGTAAGRNAGVNAAGFEHIAFIDGDCTAPSDWLSKLMAGFDEWKARDPEVIAVGGPNIAPPSADPFIRAVAVALDSYPGSFSSAQGRQFVEACEVQSLANLNVVYERSAIEAVDGFDETLGSEAEDADLNFRLCRQGGKMAFLPDCHVMHWMRATPKQWYRNMFRYGKGRARLLKRFPEMWSVAYVLPLLFLVGMVSAVLAPAVDLFVLPLLYFPAIFAYSLILAARKDEHALTLRVAQVFVVQHFGYALGEAYGLLSSKVR